MKTVLNYLLPYRWRIILQMMIKFLGGITELLLPWMLSHIIDEVVPLGDIRLVFYWGAGMLLAAGAAWGSNILANHMAIHVSRVFAEQLRHDTFKKVQSLSARQLDHLTLSSISTRLTTDTYYVHQMVDRLQRMGARAPSLLLGGIIITFVLDPVLSSVIIFMLPLLTFLVLIISRKGTERFNQTQDSLDVMVRKVQEFMSGVRVIKVLSKSKLERTRFHEVSSDVMDKEKGASVLMAASSPLSNLFLNIGLTLVIVIGAYRVAAGLTSAGVIVAFLSYFTIILNSILAVARLFNIASRGIASAVRIAQVLNEPESMQIEPSKIDMSQYHILFSHVSFSYDGIQTNLNDISFQLKKGQQLGILGPTGSGKSTVVNLLLRLYDADSGDIRINGRRINSILPEELYHMFGVALQNDFLYQDSLRSNLDFGRGLTDEKLLRALEHAQAAFVTEEKGGLNYNLNLKAGNLSGGQKQRLLIARALADDPDILILDDSSSALDYKTDANLRRALHENYTETTTIIIAQRISSIMQADYIIMLEEGNIVGRGTHQELLKNNESYREIYEIQMGEGETA